MPFGRFEGLKIMTIEEIVKRLPSARLPEKVKKVVRFLIIGNTGSFVQTGFFLLMMMLLGEPEQNTPLYYIAFIGGFVLEMIPNYICSCWYTFEARPNKTNASGFILARGVNLVLQMVCLPLALKYVSFLSDFWISLIVIFVAGIINFLMQYFFFKKK